MITHFCTSVYPLLHSFIGTYNRINRPVTNYERLGHSKGKSSAPCSTTRGEERGRRQLAAGTRLEEILKRHLLHDVLKRERNRTTVRTDRGARNKRVCEASPRRVLTVLATMLVNSSKLSLPSQSLSASMIVLSTISWSWVSCGRAIVSLFFFRLTWAVPVN